MQTFDISVSARVHNQHTENSTSGSYGLKKVASMPENGKEND